jgi:hypothetical protein
MAATRSALLEDDSARTRKRSWRPPEHTETLFRDRRCPVEYIIEMQAVVKTLPISKLLKANLTKTERNELAKMADTIFAN